MEFSGINNTIRRERVEAIAVGAKKYYPELEITAEEKSLAKSGMRPVTPDGLPYIGRSSKIKNLTFATGHAMMGLSLGPATGSIISSIVNNKTTPVSIKQFHPDRRF